MTPHTRLPADPPPPHPPARQGHPLLVLGAILCLAAGLRAFGLAAESFWLDELSALNVAKSSTGELFEHLRHRDVHPPLYFLMLKGWGAVFGFGEVGARSLSALVGVAAVLFAWLLGRRLGGARAGTAAALLLAVSPFATYYAREARAYSLLLCVSLAATWLFVRAAPTFPVRRLVPYALALAALPYTHVFGVFTAGAHLAGAVALVAWRRSDRAAFGRFVLAGAAAVVLYLPWLPATLAQTSRVSRGFWIGPPTPRAWLGAWLLEGPFAVAWVVVTVAAAAVALWRLRRRAPADAVLLLAGLLLPTLVPIALSYVRQPIFVAKYAIAATGLVLVVAALALAAIPGRIGLVALALLAAVGTADTIRDVHLRQQKEDWRGLAAFASEQSVEQGYPLVMTVHYASHLANYLDPRATLWPVGEHELTTDGRDALWRRLEERGARSFWLLNVHPDRTDPALEPLFRERWRPAVRQGFYMAEAILWVDVRAHRGQDQP